MSQDIGTAFLEAENRRLHERIGALEKANADLHSRLDELRRVFNPVSGALLARTSTPLWPPGTIWRGQDIGSMSVQGSVQSGEQTAYDRLRERMSGGGDPEGGE